MSLRDARPPMRPIDVAAALAPLLLAAAAIFVATKSG